MDIDISNRTYTFTLNDPNPDILGYYLLDNNPLYESFVGKTENEYEITFKRPLTMEELSSFTEWITNWVQPSIYLIFDHAETYTLSTPKVSSSDLTTLTTFIMSKYILSQTSVVLGSLKTILHISAPNVESFVNWDSNELQKIKIQLFCMTRNVIINEDNVDITNTILNWKQKAINGQTGQIEEWLPYQVYGLDNVLPDYDCVWQWKVACEPSNVHVDMNSLQRIYYTRITK